MACLEQNLITYFLSNIFNKKYDVRGLYVRQKHVIMLECIQGDCLFDVSHLLTGPGSLRTLWQYACLSEYDIGAKVKGPKLVVMF